MKMIKKYVCLEDAREVLKEYFKLLSDTGEKCIDVTDIAPDVMDELENAAMIELDCDEDGAVTDERKCNRALTGIMEAVEYEIRNETDPYYCHIRDEMYKSGAVTEKELVEAEGFYKGLKWVRSAIEEHMHFYGIEYDEQGEDASAGASSENDTGDKQNG